MRRFIKIIEMMLYQKGRVLTLWFTYTEITTA